MKATNLIIYTHSGRNYYISIDMDYYKNNSLFGFTSEIDIKLNKKSPRKFSFLVKIILFRTELAICIKLRI